MKDHLEIIAEVLNVTKYDVAFAAHERYITPSEANKMMREAAKQAFDKSYWTASDLRYTFEEYLKQVEP